MVDSEYNERCLDSLSDHASEIVYNLTEDISCLKEEIERLRLSCSELSRDALASTFEIERLRAENERLIAFCRGISEQLPEHPDCWSSCSQCAKNTYTAEDILETLKPDSGAG